MAYLEKTAYPNRQEFFEPQQFQHYGAARPPTPHPLGLLDLFDLGPANSIEHREHRDSSSSENRCYGPERWYTWGWVSEGDEATDDYRDTSWPRSPLSNLEVHTPGLENDVAVCGVSSDIRGVPSDAERYCPTQACYSDRLIMFEGAAVRSDCQRSHGAAMSLVTGMEPSSEASERIINLSNADTRSAAVDTEPELFPRRTKGVTELAEWVQAFVLGRDQDLGLSNAQLFICLFRERWNEVFELFPTELPPPVEMDLAMYAEQVLRQRREERSKNRRPGLQDSSSACHHNIGWEDILTASKALVRLAQGKRSAASTGEIKSSG